MRNGIGRCVGLVALFVVMGVEGAAGQVFTPTFMAPRSSSDLGIYLSDGPGEFSIEGIWRRSSGSYDLGLRGGVADADDLILLLGAEIRNPLSVSAPIDVAVSGTAQGAFGDRSAGGVLLGVAVGHTFEADDLAITPYFHPRAGMVRPFFPDEWDLELLADIGVDVRIGSNLELRFGFGFDEPTTDWGIGLAWR